MKHISLHDVTITELCHAEPLDTQHALNFEQFVQASGLEAAWVLQLFEFDILDSHTAAPQQHRFISDDLQRARKAFRLQRDFDANLQAVAVMLDLIEEVQSLRSQIRLLDHVA